MFYKKLKKPHFGLIAIAVSLAMISENVYSPALPQIAQYLNVSDALVEYTMTIYLLGFGVGVLFWGILSDKLGRRPCLLAGLVTYFLGAMGCWSAETIEALLFFRFIQAFGGSTCSVLGQSILRDSTEPQNMGKAFSNMSTAIAISLGIGPVIGGYLVEYFGWKSNFKFLGLLSLLIITLVFFFLPETRPLNKKNSVSLQQLWANMKIVLSDRKVLAYGFLVGGCNGIMFSYFAEGPFVLIEILRQDPSVYGYLTLMVAVPWALGGIISNKLHKKGFEGKAISAMGCYINLLGCAILLGLAYSGVLSVETGMLGVVGVVVPLMVAFIGIGLIIPNALSQALMDYKEMSGTAASIFGFFYYLVISSLTYIMGTIHNDTVFPMPIFFVLIGGGMIFIFNRFVRKPKVLSV